MLFPYLTICVTKKGYNLKMANYKYIIDKTFSLWVPVIVWALVIFLFSSKPTGTVTEIQVTDFIVKKSAHIIEYAIFTILIYRALCNSGVSKKESAIYSLILALIYGASDEFHQSFTPGRDPKIRDVFFDTTGSLSAIFLIRNYLPKAPRELRQLAEKLKIS